MNMSKAISLMIISAVSSIYAQSIEMSYTNPFRETKIKVLEMEQEASYPGYVEIEISYWDVFSNLDADEPKEKIRVTEKMILNTDPYAIVMHAGEKVFVEAEVVRKNNSKSNIKNSKVRAAYEPSEVPAIYLSIQTQHKEKLMNVTLTEN